MISTLNDLNRTVYLNLVGLITLNFLFVLINYLDLTFLKLWHLYFLVFSIVLFLCPLRYRILIILVILLDFILSLILIDFSSDGATYHVIAINELVNSINPYTYISHDIRIDTYPILPWLLPAAIKQLFPEFVNISSFGKLYLAFLLFIYAFEYCKKYNSIIISILISILISFPPIFLTQIYTGYLDYWTYFTACLLVISLIKYNESPSIDNIKILSLILILLLIVKFQTVVYLIIFSPLLIYILYKHQDNFIEFFKYNLSTVFLYFSLFIVSFSAIYFNNILNYGSLVPFASEKGATKILFDNSFYTNTDAWKHLYYSLFSRVSLNTDSPIIDLFYFPTFGEFIQYSYPDTRFGASGPLFGILIILLFVFALIFKNIVLYIICLYIFLSMFIPGTGIMRYYPLIQASPFLFLLAIKDNSKEILNININGSVLMNLSLLSLKKIFITIGLINIIFIFSSSTSYQYYRTQTYLNFVETIKNEKPLAINFGGWVYHKYILERLGAKFSSDFRATKCIPLKSKYKVHIHDEVTICNKIN